MVTLRSGPVTDPSPDALLRASKSGTALALCVDIPFIQSGRFDNMDPDRNNMLFNLALPR